jgi:acyl carrier protein
MEKKEMIATINDALAQEFEVEVSVIEPDAIIKDTLHLDSLALVDMVALIESIYKVKISGKDINRIKKFGDLYDVISEQLNT